MTTNSRLIGVSHLLGYYLLYLIFYIVVSKKCRSSGAPSFHSGQAQRLICIVASLLFLNKRHCVPFSGKPENHPLRVCLFDPQILLDGMVRKIMIVWGECLG